MTKGQMEKAMKDIAWLENVLMRDLNSDEIMLCLNDEMFKITDALSVSTDSLLKIRSIISAYFTEDEKVYFNKIKSINPNEQHMLELVCKQILSDIEKKKTISTIETKTKVKVNTDNICSDTYKEDLDKDLEKYFNAESTKEVDEAISRYIPEHDEGINECFNDCLNESKASNLTIPKAFVCSNDSKITSPSNMTEDIYDKIYHLGQGESLKVTPTEYHKISNKIFNIYGKCSTKYIDGVMTAEF